MAYEGRRLARQKVRYDNANDDLPLIYQLVEAGEKVTPTSATITIYRPGNSTALVDAEAMTVSGTLLTYVPDTTTEANWPVDQGYRADIVVTASSKTYDRHIIFDVAKYVFVPNIGVDQLVAMDDGIRGQLHDGDEDFSELIEACRDDLQLLIESKILDGGGLLEEHALDASRFAIPFRHYCLAKIWENANDYEKSDRAEEKFNRMFNAALSGMRFDKSQDGEEDSDRGIQEVRLVT